MGKRQIRLSNSKSNWQWWNGSTWPKCLSHHEAMLQARDQNRVFDAADASTGVEPVATRRPAPRPPHLPPLHSHRAAVPRRPECGDARRRRRPPSRCHDCRAAARRCLPSRGSAAVPAVAATSARQSVAGCHCGRLAVSPRSSCIDCAETLFQTACTHAVRIEATWSSFGVCSAGGHFDGPRAKTKDEKGLHLSFFKPPATSEFFVARPTRISRLVRSIVVHERAIAASSIGSEGTSNEIPKRTGHNSRGRFQSFQHFPIFSYVGSMLTWCPLLLCGAALPRHSC